MAKYYLKLDDLEEKSVAHNGKHVKFWIPRVIVCGECMYKRRKTDKNMRGNFGAVFVYDPFFTQSIFPSICIKITDNEALCEGTDIAYRVNGVCPNAGSGEIHSKAWTARLDPNDNFFVTRFSPGKNSIVACWVNDEEKKCLNGCYDTTSVENVCTQNADNVNFVLYHYTVMECYEGNVVDLMRILESQAEAARQETEKLAWKTFQLLMNTLSSLEKYGFFYKDMSLLQIVFKRDRLEDYTLKLVDFANISCLRVEKRASNYGAVVPPAYKKILCKEKKKYVVDGDAWYDVTITKDGLLYQVAFVVAQILSAHYGYQHFFKANNHPYMYYDGPYDKHITELQNLVAHLKSLLEKNNFICDTTNKLFHFCVHIFVTQLTMAEKQACSFL